MADNHSHTSSNLAPSMEPGPSWVHPTNSTVPKVMEWEGVSVEFEGRRVISDLSVWIHRGELTCICGANGAGKTQLIRVGLGFVLPMAGTVKLLGEAPLLSRWQVGYVPQLKTFSRNYPATVEDVLVAALRGSWPLLVRKFERDKAAVALRRVGGLTLIDKDIGVLSGGELQRVFLARALVSNPQILVLAEPMAAVDSKGRAGMFELLAGLRDGHEITIVLITHSDAIVSELSDRVMFLEKGRLVGWGTPAEVMTIESLREVAFFGHDHEAAIHGAEG